MNDGKCISLSFNSNIIVGNMSVRSNVDRRVREEMPTEDERK